MARNKDFIRTLAQKLFQWKPTHTKRSRDRPSKSWLDCVKEDYHVASGCNSNFEDMKIAAEDRRVADSSETERTCIGGRSLE